MYIGFIRHGETDWARAGRLQGREDIPLNDKGRQQIEALARTLNGTDWGQIYCSPLSRTKESAAIIAAALNLDPPTVLADLIERDFGQAAGLTLEERKACFPTQLYPGMESDAAVRKRVRASLDYINQAGIFSRRRSGKSDDQPALGPPAAPSGVLVVTHGGWLHELANLYGSDHAQSWQKVRLKLAGFSLTESVNGKLNFITFNQSAADMAASAQAKRRG
ncbi:MAG: histidine phosphatase family protein [Oscillospiraceae bacterium]|nr:histidine phosphatase family protein [Oscillospiraceae bacterium]MDD4368252.1 histidine phosphatase family protein [Oscillospiraceae bacterium]